MYAGVDGNKTDQGNAPAVNGRRASAPSTRSTPTTVLRGGYGLYWAPFNYPAPSSATQQLRPGRLHAEHDPRRRPPARRRTLDEPVPERRRQRRSATASARSPASARHQLRRPEPHRAARAAVLGRPAARAAGQHGADASATSARAAITCRSAARTTSRVNINQLDPKYLALGSRARTPRCRIPFFGNAERRPARRRRRR